LWGEPESVNKNKGRKSETGHLSYCPMGELRCCEGAIEEVGETGGALKKLKN